MALSSESAECNKPHIFKVLQEASSQLRDKIENRKLKILEIASGTGEHAALFATMPNVEYQPTEPDCSMHESIRAWSSSLPNVKSPISLNVHSQHLENIIPENIRQTDILICINMIHIAPLGCTEQLFRVASECINKDGFVLLYGPYRVNNYMVDSNIRFDLWLKAKNPEYGVRDLEVVCEYARQYGFHMTHPPIAMPENNLTVLFHRI